MNKENDNSSIDLDKFTALFQENYDYLNELLSYYTAEHEKFDTLINRDHDLVGQILKFHLVIELYMDNYLSDHYKNPNIDDVKLTYYQKAKLLPEDEIIVLVKNGILEINKIRNKFSHNLDAEFDENDINMITESLSLLDPKGKNDTLIDAIERFTSIACTLFVLPSDLKQHFKEQIIGDTGDEK